LTGERVTRRLAAILAADVVGYSRLMGLDEQGTLARLKAHRTERLEPTLARHGGRLVKLTGDGALVEFPSAVDALGAAIEFQQAMAEANRDQPEDSAIVFRIGLHLGDLIVDGDDLYGDGVNVAARLEAEAPAGGIVISRTVHEAVVGRLKATFDDLGSLALKNIERPVQAFAVTWEPADWKVPAPLTAVPLVVATPQPADIPLALPGKPSIAVLAFTNMSGDPEQEYFTDGISDDIITELSRFRELFVIARNSSFTYKGKTVDIKQVGQELGVRYVLEGSIRRSGNRARITAQLIEAASGAHVWAERYDRVLKDIFEVQEEVTRAIVSALAPEIAATEHARVMRRRPEDVSAYEIALRAWSDVLDAHQTTERDVMKRAVAGAKKALTIDPNSVLAWQTLSFARQLEGWHQFSANQDETFREAEEPADRAVALDGADARSVALRAHCSFTARDFERQPAALVQARRAHEMNPNDTFVLWLVGNLEASVGDPGKAIEQCHRILRLNPRDARIHMVYTLLAFACVAGKRWAEGATWAARTVNDAPRSASGYGNLINCLVGLGEIQRAKAAFKKAQELFPDRFLEPIGRASFGRSEVNEWTLLFRRIAAGLEDPAAAEPYR
jgi:adenylate cyclase